MAVEKEIDLYNSDDFEFNFVEESDDTIKNVRDGREYILPLKEIEEEISNPWEIDDSMETKEQDEDEIGMQPVDKDDQKVDSQFEEKTEILLNENDVAEEMAVKKERNHPPHSNRNEERT